MIAAPALRLPLRFALAVAACLAVSGCGPSETSSAGGTSSKPASAPTTAERIRVRTERPSRDSIASFLETTAHVEAILEAEVYAKTSGIVREVRAEEGDRVRAGQVLVVLDQVEARIAEEQARLALDESKRALEEAKLNLEEAEKKGELAKADAEQAKRDYERDRTLGESAADSRPSIVAPKVVEASRLSWQRAENAYSVVRFVGRRAELSRIAAESGVQKADLAWRLAKVRLADTEIPAPIDGVVTMRGVKAGETATLSTKVYRVTNVNELQTAFYRPQRDLRLLGAGGQEVTASSEALVAESTGEPRVFRGKVERVSPVVDPASGSFKVTASLQNPDGLLRPGLLVRVQVTLGRREHAFLVPKRARVLDGEKPFVFVVRAGKTVRVAIQEGFADAERIEVRNIDVEGGLRADDDVVVVANVDLREGLAVTLENEAAAAASTIGG